MVKGLLYSITHEKASLLHCKLMNFRSKLQLYWGIQKPFKMRVHVPSIKPVLNGNLPSQWIGGNGNLPAQYLPSGNYDVKISCELTTYGLKFSIKWCVMSEY